MRLDLLSKYRTQLMGLAILWVMLFHSTLLSPEGPEIFIFLKKVGYGGVDIFMLLSGFGVYYAISKGEPIIKFYKKRILRILPYYYPVVIVFSIFSYITDTWNLGDVINNLFLTGFWLHRGFLHIFDWYIPSLLLLYLITPVFYYFFKKNKTGTTLGLILFFLIFIYLTREIFTYLSLFTFRAPIYFFGFWLGDFLRNHKDFKISPVFSIVLFILLILGIALLYYFYSGSFEGNYFIKYCKQLSPYYLITFPLCMFLVYIFSLFKTHTFPVLTFFGMYSLTIYIFHDKTLRVGEFLYLVATGGSHIRWFPEGDPKGTVYLWIFNIVCYTISIIIAVAWQKYVDKKIARFK